MEQELRQELELSGAIFHTTNDSEIISYMIIRERLKQPSIEKALENNEYPYMIDKRVNWLVRVPGRDPKHAEYYICYAHSRNCRCLDGFDLTRQLIEQRQQCQWTIGFCRRYLPGFAKAWLIDSAPLLGVRESRRIMGDYKITGEDIVDGARFDDAIARAMKEV